MLIIDGHIRAAYGKTKPAERAKKPEKFQALYHQPAGMEIECSICLLRDAFNLSYLKAHDKVVLAEKQGKVPVVISTKEVISEKVRGANKNLSEGQFCSLINFEHIKFTSEPAP